jgi:hypothetical protein
MEKAARPVERLSLKNAKNDIMADDTMYEFKEGWYTFVLTPKSWTS